MRYFICPASAVLFFLFTGFTVSAQIEEQQSTISFRFAWPLPLTLHVEKEVLEITHTRETSDTLATRLRSRMEAVAHSRGVLIDERPMTEKDERSRGAIDDDAARANQGLQELLLARPFRFLVSPTGKYLGLGDLSDMQSVIDSLAQRLSDLTVHLPEALRRDLAGLWSEDLLNRSAAAAWDKLVGAWAGAEFNPALMHVTELQMPNPFVPGQTIRVNSVSSVYGEQPCTEDAAGTGCVLIWIISLPENYSSGDIQDGGSPRLRSARKEKGKQNRVARRVIRQVWLTVDPSTLLPFLLAEVSVVEVKFEDAPEEDFVPESEQWWTFRYLVIP